MNMTVNLGGNLDELIAVTNNPKTRIALTAIKELGYEKEFIQSSKNIPTQLGELMLECLTANFINIQSKELTTNIKLWLNSIYGISKLKS